MSNKSTKPDVKKNDDVNSKVNKVQTPPQTAVPDPAPILQKDRLTPQDAQNLQRTIGNQALRRLTIQRKMTLGPVGDKYEQEADTVAKQVVGQLNSSQSSDVTQRQEEEEVQMKPTAQRQEEEEVQMMPLPSIIPLQRQEEEEMQMKPMAQRQEEEEVQMKPLPSISALQRQEEEEVQMKPLLQRQEEEEVQAKLDVQRQEEEEVQAKSLVQRQEEEEVQTKQDPMLTGGELSGDVETAVTQAKSGGSPLSDEVRQPMESAFNADFSNVKVHTDTQSDNLNRSISARAFTSGQDIFFRSGEYNPSSSGGKELLAHELTHTIQQGAATQRKPVQRHPSHAEEQEVQGKRIQRHPGHGEEQQVQTKRLQRHPSHAEEQEVQAKRDTANNTTAAPPSISQKGGQTIQRLISVGEEEQITSGNAIKKLESDYKFLLTGSLRVQLVNWDKAGKQFESWNEMDEKLRSDGHLLKHQDKKIRLEAKYGIPIGGESGIEQFGNQMLDTLDTLFSYLPPSHLSAMKAVVRQKEDTASFYDPNNKTLTISYAQPAWLYTWGKKNTKAFGKDARKLMEEAAVPVMMQGTGYSTSKDEELGLDSKQRSVISYSRKDKFADTKIVEWTVLHEIGHAVDDRIKWTTRNGSNPQFGGWKTHGDREDQQAQEEIAEVYLQDAGLSLSELEQIQVSEDERLQKNIDKYLKDAEKYQKNIDDGKMVDFYTSQKQKKMEQIQKWRDQMGVTETGKQLFMSEFLGTNPDFKNKIATKIASGVSDENQRQALEQKLKEVYQIIMLTQAVPWQFPDGLASKIKAENGRIYQLDHYKDWVSYLADARKNLLSPYQFSSPGEWIAEAYAAFYGTNKKARNLLTSATRDKIQEELGAPPSKKQAEEDRQKGSFEDTEDDKPVLKAPNSEEEINLISVDVEEDSYSVDEFDKDFELIIGGPPKDPSPLALSLESNEEDNFKFD